MWPVCTPSRMGKNLHDSAPSAPTYVWIRGKKSTKKKTGRKKPCAGVVRGRVVGRSFRAFLRDLLPKSQKFFTFFFFGKSNLRPARDIKFKHSFFFFPFISARIDSLQQNPREPSPSQPGVLPYQPILLLWRSIVGTNLHLSSWGTGREPRSEKYKTDRQEKLKTTPKKNKKGSLMCIAPSSPRARGKGSTFDRQGMGCHRRWLEFTRPTPHPPHSRLLNLEASWFESTWVGERNKNL